MAVPAKVKAKFSRSIADDSLALNIGSNDAAAACFAGAPFYFLEAAKAAGVAVRGWDSSACSLLSRQLPLKSAPFSMINAPVKIFPVTLALWPRVTSSRALMSPSTVPFIFATPTSMVALVICAPELTMRVPPSDLTCPQKFPSMRKVDLKVTSPVNFRTSPTKPSQLSLGIFVRRTGSSSRNCLTIHMSLFLVRRSNLAGQRKIVD